MAPHLNTKFSLLTGLAGETLAAFDGSRFLWYDEPVPEWERGALPIDCGRLGPSVFGGGNETLTIIEDTIWSGPIRHRIPENALEGLPKVRELLMNNKITEAGQITLREMRPVEESQRQSRYFGNLD